MSTLDFSNYLSPFSWRYGSAAMKTVFSERHKHELWRTIWVTLAEVQQQAGLVSKAEVADLKKQLTTIDLARIHQIESETKHDVVAGIREFAEKSPIGGSKIHLGATSMDIVDNTDMLRMQEAVELIETQVKELLNQFAKQIEQHADTVCMGYTHLQPAEPTTVGYRLSITGQDLLLDWQLLQFVKNIVAGKGMKGAVGTAASYQEILAGTKLTAEQLDQQVMARLGISSVLIANQVYPRKFDYLLLSALASIATSLAKFAADLRVLQQPAIGEWSEPFGKKQVGSSAMPFKKNPLHSEKICSLARYVVHLPAIALQNAMHSYLERTLDDSANKRVIIPEAFLAVDEMLGTATKLISGLVINPERISFNLHQYAPFSATELIIIAAVKKGADRQAMHELMRTHAMTAWAAVQAGKPNPLMNLLEKDPVLKRYLSVKEIQKVSDVSHHVGNAPARARTLVKQIRQL